MLALLTIGSIHNPSGGTCRWGGGEGQCGVLGIGVLVLVGVAVVGGGIARVGVKVNVALGGGVLVVVAVAVFVIVLLGVGLTPPLMLITAFRDRRNRNVTAIKSACLACGFRRFERQWAVIRIGLGAESYHRRGKVATGQVSDCARIIVHRSCHVVKTRTG
jgi:hypothetical protein